MSMLRRNSSKQGLQDLQRITVQRILEDSEEIERERRRAARAGGSTEISQNSSSPDLCEKSSFQSCKKPSCLSSSDGVDTFNTNLAQVKKKTRPETCDRAGGNLNNSAHLSHTSSPNSAHQHLNGLTDHPSHSTSLPQTLSSSSQQNDQHGMELYKAGEWREKERVEQDMRECKEYSITGKEKTGRQADEVVWIRSGERQEKEQKKETISNITTARFEKDLDCDTANRTRNTLRKSSCLREEDCAAEAQLGEGPPENEREEQTLTCEGVEEVWVKEENVEERVVEQTEEERVLEEIEEERVLEETEEEIVKDQTEEEKVQEETEEEMLKERTEEERVPEETEEEIVIEQTKDERVVEETDEERVKRMREEEREKKRLGVMERMKRLSLSSAEADEPFSPLSPTLMISDRTESLNQSVKRSNSFQKTSPSVTISKIDSRLEQYNHAVEGSVQETKDTKAVPTDFPTDPEPVSARKNLFEAGDVWNQNSARVACPTDTEGLNVGVADLITHWVKGNPDADSKISSCKPTSEEVKAGDVRNKKTLWESKETSTAEKPGGKGGKSAKYKFVEVSHGKYEKVLVEEGDSSKLKNGK